MKHEQALLSGESSCQLPPWLLEAGVQYDIKGIVAALTPTGPEPDPRELTVGVPEWLDVPQEGAKEFRLKLPDDTVIAGRTQGDLRGVAVFKLDGMPSDQLGGFVDDVLSLDNLQMYTVSYNRPGYRGSTRKPGRLVSDEARNVEAIADALGIDNLNIYGRSWGAKAALACRTLLGERVKRVLLAGAHAPIDAEGLDLEAGMGPENTGKSTRKRTYAAISAEFEEKREAVQRNPFAILRHLYLTGDLRQSDIELLCVGDNALRVAASHYLSLQDGLWGYYDDMVALQKPTDFALEIDGALTDIWIGAEDTLTPKSHGYWLASRIGANIHESPDRSHFTGMDVSSLLFSFFGEIVEERRLSMLKELGLMSLYHSTGFR